MTGPRKAGSSYNSETLVVAKAAKIKNVAILIIWAVNQRIRKYNY